MQAASYRCGTYELEQEQLKLIELLLKLGAEFDAQSNDGSTALIFAVKGYNYAAVETLLRHNASVNIRDYSGGISTIRIQSPSGTIKSNRIYGMTALGWADMQKHKKIANLLKRHGAIK